MKFDLEHLRQKARERTVKTQAVEYDLDTLVRKIRNGTIKIDPEYQRNHRWDDDTSSRLIESLILNIPIPVIYLSMDVDVDEESDDDIPRYSVIDGQQRLTAIRDFFEGALKLKGLKALPGLIGATFAELPPFLVRRLEERTVKCLRIDSTVDPQVKYDIFERLNSGSVKLTPQELRNAVYRGNFNDLLKDLAQNPYFRKMLQINESAPESSAKVKKMGDIEAVLRFFALVRNDKYAELKGKMKEFLDARMKELSSVSESEISKMRSSFMVCISMIYNLMGDEAFAKWKYVPENEEFEQMSAFNIAVYDALMAAAYECYAAGEKALPQGFADDFLSLFGDVKFFESVSGSMNDTKKVVYRIDAAKEVLGA